MYTPWALTTDANPYGKVSASKLIKESEKQVDLKKLV
jgi:hypothetical protein